MAFQAVFFDAYGTLFEDAIEKLKTFCGQIAREQNLGLSPGAFMKVWDRAYYPLIKGDDFFTLREAHLISLDRVFQDLNVEQDPGNYVEAIFEWLSQAPVYADVEPTLAGLDGVMTGVISNADMDHLDAALECNGLQFSVVESSESAGCYKPEPEIFFRALEAMGCKAEEALYVGDSQEDDIVGAKRAGMRVAWLNRQGRILNPGIPKPDYEIVSLEEVLGIV